MAVIIKYKGDLCSINQRYAFKKVLSPRYRQCKESIGWSVKNALQSKYEPLRGNLKVKLVTLYNHWHDIDAFTKVVLDSLNGIVWEDDRQIVELTVKKRKSKVSGFVLKVDKQV